MTVKVRFAPSPTGNLHLGNIRAAALNYFLSQKLNGTFLLRIDNTDIKRCKEEYVTSIKEDLFWLGYTWDEEFRQFDRLTRYQEVLTLLEQTGYVYKCFETEQELDHGKKMQLANKLPPIYNRVSLRLTPQEMDKYITEGRKPHYRFKIDNDIISWVDLIKHETSFKGENLSDPVIVREDGTFLYILTSVIDDIDKAITHIVRGEDHIVNTAVQIQMFKAVSKALNLPLQLPQFAHFSLVVDENGVPFSKRDGSMTIGSLKKSGILPLAINISLFTLGLSENNTKYSNIASLVKEFDLTKYGKSTVQLSISKLTHLNISLLQQESFASIKLLSKNLLEVDITEDFWENIKHNIKQFDDIKLWFNITHNKLDIKPFTNIINKDIIKAAIKTMPPASWNETTWPLWLTAIKAESGLSNKDIFHSLRLALTGLESGMEFKFLITLLGNNLVLNRLNNSLS